MEFLAWFFGWFFIIMLVAVYVVALVTVAVLTFQKGYILLGILGTFLPFLWLIGAILPAPTSALRRSARA